MSQACEDPLVPARGGRSFGEASWKPLNLRPCTELPLHPRICQGVAMLFANLEMQLLFPKFATLRFRWSQPDYQQGDLEVSYNLCILGSVTLDCGLPSEDGLSTWLS
jgi:hypothetical protein